LKRKPIRDIRFYESDEENVDGFSPPSETGRVYKLPADSVALGACSARKLAAEGFTAPGYDHVYVNLTPLLRQGDVRVSPRQVEDWLVYVDAGVDPSAWTGLSVDERRQALIAITTKALRALCRRDGLEARIVQAVGKLIAARECNLDFVCKSKETAQYSVAVTYQIKPPSGQNSPSYIEYLDKRTGAAGKSPFVTLDWYDDVFALVGTIAVSKGAIKVAPSP